MTATTLDTFYPNLRDMLDDRYAGLPDAEFEAAFESAFGEHVTPAEYEEFFGGLGKALSSAVSTVAPVVQSALPGVAQGAMAGSALGPWGALGGAVLGGVGSVLSKQGGTAGQVGRTVGGVVNTAGALTGRSPVAGGVAGAATSGLSALLGQSGAPATNALRAVLGSPQLAQALGALFAGRNPQLPVGPAQTPVPASALTGLLGMLAKEAEDEAEAYGAYGTATPAYLVDQNGQLVVDPSSPEQRAARVLQLLAGEFEDSAPDDRETAGWSNVEWTDEWAELDVEDIEAWADAEEEVL
jgi:hypothetical protein